MEPAEVSENTNVDLGQQEAEEDYLKLPGAPRLGPPEAVDEPGIQPTPTPPPTTPPPPSPEPTPTRAPTSTPPPSGMLESAREQDEGRLIGARATTGASPLAGRVSVVVVSHNEGENLLRTVESVLGALPPEGEILVVDDQSTDGSAEALPGGDRVQVLRRPERLGVARARNLGARQAGGDVLVFADAHVQVPPNWAEPLVDALSRPGVAAVGPAVAPFDRPENRGYGFRWENAALKIAWLDAQGPDPEPVPLLVGCFFAMRRDVFDEVGGFDTDMPVWGMEDAEMSLRLWTLGYECLAVPSVEVLHLFRSKHPYEVGWEIVLHNMLRTAVIHFGQDRLRRVVETMVKNDAFPAAFARLAAGDAWERRREMLATRRHDDDWFFQRFGMDW
jgi:GT2 family glycosyltransferase